MKNQENQNLKRRGMSFLCSQMMVYEQLVKKNEKVLVLDPKSEIGKEFLKQM